MKFSNFKTPVVGLMLVSVLSLNFVNPLASRNLIDMKGTVTQIPVSASKSVEFAISPSLVVAHASVLIYLATKCGNKDLQIDSYLYDGIAKVDRSGLAMNKLD